MDANISKEQRIAGEFLGSLDHVPIKGAWVFEITRADGTVEVSTADNVVTAAGMNAIAQLAINEITSHFLYIGIGTVTVPASLGSTVTQFGESSRKLAVSMVTSQSLIIGVATWAGAADGITSVVFGTGVLLNAPNSGTGIAANMVNSLSATLADSDHLRAFVHLRVGSHNL